jgi:hypothetical protein
MTDPDRLAPRRRLVDQWREEAQDLMAIAYGEGCRDARHDCADQLAGVLASLQLLEEKEVARNGQVANPPIAERR